MTVKHTGLVGRDAKSDEDSHNKGSTMASADEETANSSTGHSSQSTNALVHISVEVYFISGYQHIFRYLLG